MRNVIPRTRGAITIEYLLVAVALFLTVWLALVGGTGDWRDIDRPVAESALPHRVPNPIPAESSPNLIKVLDDRQHEFAREIYQP
ncbi:MAG: hypothetical protein R3F47_14540 [Gammaproteobacteria bacterium]